ncbi:MAG: flagellar biosynthetic protein FliO [Pseudomonadota bacterium]
MSPRLFSFAILPSASLARAAEVSAGATAGAAPDLGSSALQMVLGLIVVLALLLGALWLLKRISQPQGAAAGLLRVVAGIAVGSRERVVILELGNSWLVLGVAPGHVSTLAEIPRQEVPTSAVSTAGKDFPAWLRQMVERRGKP